MMMSTVGCSAAPGGRCGGVEATLQSHGRTKLSAMTGHVAAGEDGQDCGGAPEWPFARQRTHGGGCLGEVSSRSVPLLQSTGNAQQCCSVGSHRDMLL